MMNKTVIKTYIFLILFLSAGGFFSLQAYANADTTPPRITGITLDKTTAHVGDTVTFSITIEEEGTGYTGVVARMDNTSPGNNTSFGVWTDEMSQEGYSGTLQLSQTVTKDTAPGVYVFGYVQIADQAYNQNVYRYYNSDEQGLTMMDETTGDSFIISNEMQLTIINDDYQAAPFSATSLEMKKNSFKTDDTIPVDMVIEGELPDTFNVNMEFCYEEGTYFPHALMFAVDKKTVSHEGKLYHFNLEIASTNGPPLEWVSGKYSISSIVIQDATGKYERRYMCSLNGEYIDTNDFDKCSIIGSNQITFTKIEKDIDKDKTKPVFKSVRVSGKQVARPGVVNVDLDIQDETCIQYANLSIEKDGVCIVGSSQGGSWDNYDNQKLKSWSGRLKLYVPRYAQLGKCQLVIDIGDSAFNYSRYCVDIEIIDEFDIAFDVGTENPKLLEKINALKPSETGFIKLRNDNYKAKKEIFSAIKGKDINIVFYSDYFDWIFNGKDITSPKDIIISTTCYPDTMMDGTQGLRIVFPDNGILPGKAQIRIQSDVIATLWDIENNLLLYYLNSKGILVKQNNRVDYINDGNSHWCYFTITHNSTYFLSSKQIKQKANNQKSQKVSRIYVSGISHNIAAGKRIRLSATVLSANANNKKIKWTSSNKKVATVTQTGVVTVKKKAGGKKVNIIAKATDGSGKKAVWKIKVMKGAVKSISVKGQKNTLKPGAAMQLKAIIKVTNGKPVNKKLRWTVNNKKWATVTQSGKVKALKAGKGKTVTVTVSSTDGTNKRAGKKIKIK